MGADDQDTQKPEAGRPALPLDVHALVQVADNICSTVQQVTLALAKLHELRGDEGISLSILRDRSERLETNVSMLQETVDLVVNRVTDPRTRETEIMASIVNALLDVGETMDTVKEAITGLTLQIQADREAPGCAWREFLGTRKDDEGRPCTILDDLALIASMAEKFQTVIEDDLSAKGYDPKTGVKREWINIQVDKLRASVATTIMNLIATGILGGIFWLWYAMGTSNQLAQIKAEALKAQAQHQAEKADLTKQLEDARSETKRLKSIPKHP